MTLWSVGSRICLGIISVMTVWPCGMPWRGEVGTAAGGTQRDRHLGCWKGVGTFKDLGLGVSWGLGLFIRLLTVPDGLDHAFVGLQSRLGAA